MGNACSCCETGPWDSHPEVVAPYKVKREGVYQDMTLPLSHYFISSGHNSYLTGNQLTSPSGTATIIACLKARCRVIELDVYNGPVCKHGGTLTKSVAFKDCVAAVAAHAFTSSQYPVIITMENHADTDNQGKMAAILREVLGDALYVPDPNDPMTAWKSPEQLRGKVLLRTSIKKNVHPDFKAIIYICNAKFTSYATMHTSEKVSSSSFEETTLAKCSELGPIETAADLKDSLKKSLEFRRLLKTNKKLAQKEEEPPPPAPPAAAAAKPSATKKKKKSAAAAAAAAAAPADAAPAPADGAPAPADGAPAPADGAAAPTEPTPGAEGGAGLGPEAVVLEGVAAEEEEEEEEDDDEAEEAVEPGDPEAEVVAGSAAELYRYTTRHLMRVYPAGWRVTSGNYSPVNAWVRGASLAALNWQVWDQPLWMNAAMFSDNGNCGYVLKPEWMRHPPATFPNPPASTLRVTIFSAHKFQGRSVSVFKDDLFVRMSLWGMPCDRSSKHTRTAVNSGRLVADTEFDFKVRFRELAILCIELMDEDAGGATAGHADADVLGYVTLPLGNLSEGEFKMALHDPATGHTMAESDTWIKARFSWVDAAAGAAKQ